LVGDAEQSLGHLASDDIDLVVEGHGDDHVRLLGAGLRQNVGMRPVPDIAPHIQRLRDRVNQRGGRVDDGDVVVFLGQALGDAVADLPRSANDDFHGASFMAAGRRLA
jgi:hypothetical protein